MANLVEAMQTAAMVWATRRLNAGALVALIFSRSVALSMRSVGARCLGPAQAVFSALARSGRVNRLESRLCRPLDKPLTRAARDEEAELDATANASIEPLP